MSCCLADDQPPDARAVRVRLSDGTIVGVAVTARPGRDVTRVSGGRRALLYVTDDDGKDAVVSLRWAGERQGAPVTGLPARVLVVAAQP